PPATSALPLHDALPISGNRERQRGVPEIDDRALTLPSGRDLDRVEHRDRLDQAVDLVVAVRPSLTHAPADVDLGRTVHAQPLQRSEEHTSELQSRFDLV